MSEHNEDFSLELYAPELSEPEDKEDTPKFKLYIYWGRDGTPVLEIDTGELEGDPNLSPFCRVYLNDSVIYENPAFQEPS